MDRIALYRKRKADLAAAGEGVRAKIASLCDADSFVELSAFSFSKDQFYGEEAQGEGVVTGFATIGGYPFYLVAQNFSVSYGGLSKANCAKIAKTLAAAEKSGTPVVYLLHSKGVRVGEGVDVLEGIGELLAKATALKGSVLQFAVLDGEVFGSSAALASLCDCVIFTKGSSLVLGSPLVLSAKEGKECTAEQLGGYDALTGAVLPAVKVECVKDAASVILRVSDLVEMGTVDAELNEPSPELNQEVTAEKLFSLIENGVELGGNTSPEVKTVLGRIGGIAVCACIMDDVKLNVQNVKKLKFFAEFACCYHLPLVLFVDCAGVEGTANANNSAVFKEIGEYLSVFDAVNGKIAVVTGKAIGLGYSLFAAKSVGFDYTYALATSEIALFESAAGAQIEYAGDPRVDKGKLAARYAEENADPVNAAKGGYLDNLIEPQFIKQYLIASLQTLAR